MTMKLLWLETLSSTHVGTGRGLGYIDLPLHREKVTGWPMIPGSSIKGVVADSYQAGQKKRQGDREKERAFGIASDEAGQSCPKGRLSWQCSQTWPATVRAPQCSRKHPGTSALSVAVRHDDGLLVFVSAQQSHRAELQNAFAC